MQLVFGGWNAFTAGRMLFFLAIDTNLSEIPKLGTEFSKFPVLDKKVAFWAQN
jgi:hypothetical protein